jgi:hypothetical protein
MKATNREFEVLLRGLDNSAKATNTPLRDRRGILATGHFHLRPSAADESST